MSIKIIKDAWNNFWFQESSALYLGLLRIALISYLVFDLPGHFLLLHWSADLPQEFSNSGVILRLLSLLNIPFPFPAESVTIFQIVLRSLGICAALGLFSLLTLPAFALGYAYLMALESAWGWHDHGPSLIVQILIVLAISPGARCLSLDNLVKAVRKKTSFRALFTERCPRWGLQMILVLVSAFYFSSGFSKLRYGGFAWLNGRTLAFYLDGRSVSNQAQQFVATPELKSWKDEAGLDEYLYGAQSTQLGKMVSASPAASAILATCAVLLELSVPLILLNSPLRAIILCSTALFHLSIFLMMQISFFSWIIVDLCLAFSALHFRKAKP